MNVVPVDPEPPDPESSKYAIAASLVAFEVATAVTSTYLVVNF